MRSSAAWLQSSLLGVILASAPALAAAQTPLPFPKGPTAPAAPPASTTQQPARTTPPPPPSSVSAGAPTPAAAPGTEQPPTQAILGLPVPPGAQFLGSYDAGQGQRYFLYGSGSSFTEVLTFYRNALKQRGDVVFEEPATQIFEVGRFREDSMAFPPSVVVKDYMWGNIGGYMNPKPGAQPARFPTVIQIVPVPAADRER
jgi:hypothetical protein